MKNMFSARQSEVSALPISPLRDMKYYDHPATIKYIEGTWPPMSWVQNYENSGTLGEMYRLNLCNTPGGGMIDYNKVGRMIDRLGHNTFEGCVTSAIMAAWSISKNVFIFDDTLFRSIVDGDLQEVTSEMLEHLPYNTMYLITPGFSTVVEGRAVPVEGVIFCHTKEFRHLKSKKTRAILLYAGHTADLLSFVFSVLQPSDDGILRGKEDHVTDAAILNLILYISVYMNEVRSENGNESPQKPYYKKGFGLIPRPRPKVWRVGARIGKAIREFQQKEYQGGAHASPSPHIRRAHWHTYLVGPKKNVPKDERKRLLKWIPPVPVAMWDNSESFAEAV